MRSFLTLPLLALPIQCLATSQSFLGTDNGNHSSFTPFTTSFNGFVEQLMADWHVPGLAIGVVHENKTWTKGFGYASLPDEPFTPYTLFQGASTTKSFTASLAALLVDKGEEYGSIQWDTPVHDIIGNDFVLKDDYSTSHVSLLDALSHRTGMPRHDGVWYDQNLTVKEQTYKLRYLSPSAQIRTVWQYCNMMYTVVSHVLESVTETPHATLLGKWIFEPLGMNQSYYSMQEAATCQRSNPDCKLADSYVWDDETHSYEKWPIHTNHPPNGAGGLISNVVDYTKWIRALMYESGPVSKEGHAALKAPHSVVPVEGEPVTGPVWYGMGLDGGVYRGERAYSHRGSISGYTSIIQFLPERKFGVVVFQNSQQSRAEQILAWRLTEQFLGVPENEYDDMNQTYFNQDAKAKEKLRSQPSQLFPSVSSIPVQPRLPLQNYTGTYMHPGYGNMSISLNGPSGIKTEYESAGSAGLPLYATSKFQRILYKFTHVSAEYWLVRIHMSLFGSRLPDQYTKAKFEVGADGAVEKVGIIMEAAVTGDEAWVWFERLASVEMV